MIIAGAKGFATQLSDVLDQMGEGQRVYFDNTAGKGKLFQDKFQIIDTNEEVKEYFSKTDKRFCLGVGNPPLRKKLFDLLVSLGGEPVTVISPLACLGNYDIEIGEGSCVLTHSIVESTAKVGAGCLINLMSTVTHHTTIGRFCELGPGVRVSGGCEIGDEVFIGTGAVLLPKVKVGHHSIVAAGAVVKDDVPADVLVAGVPATVKKRIEIKPHS